MALKALGLGMVDLSPVTAALKAAQDKADRAMAKANAADAKADAAGQTGTAAHQLAVDADAKAVTLEQVAATLGAAIPASEAKHAQMDAATAALKARLDAQGFATGEAVVPAIALAASTDIVVTLSRMMPNTMYRIDVLRSAALIGRFTYTEKARTTTSITLTLKAGLLISAGSSIVVIASS